MNDCDPTTPQTERQRNPIISLQEMKKSRSPWSSVRQLIQLILYQFQQLKKIRTYLFAVIAWIAHPVRLRYETQHCLFSKPVSD